MCRNIGVLQTTVAEIVTVKEHQRKPPVRISVVGRILLTRQPARAYTVMPFVWCLG
jgi:hypothetical protein